MSLLDALKLVLNGTPDAIALLFAFSVLWLSGKIFSKESIAYRDRQVEYRDLIIQRQDANIVKLQDSFDQAIKLIKEDLLPMIERQQRPKIGA